MFATICLTAWKVPSLAPNCSRSLTWATVISSTASAPPMSSAHSSAASWRRSCSSRGQAAPARPHTALAGSTTPAKRTVASRSLAKVSTGVTRTPAASAGTSTTDVPRPSRAATRKARACAPWSTKRFSPSRRSRPPRRVSTVRSAAGSASASASPSERDDLLPARDRRKPRAPLRRRAEGRQREAAREGREEPEGRHRAPPLLDQQPQVEERGPLAAVRHREPVAEPAEIRDGAPERRIVAGGCAVPFEPSLARDLGSEKPPRLLLHGLLLGGEAQVHRRLRSEESR